MDNIFKKNFMFICMILFSLIVYIIGILIVDNVLAWTVGIVFGLVVAILKIRLMQSTFEKAVLMPEAKAQKYVNKHYILRYILTAVVLVVAALEPSISLLGVFFGLCSMKAAAYMQLFVNKKEAGNSK